MEPKGQRSWKAGARSMLRWARLIFTPLSLVVIATFVWQSRASFADIGNASWTMLLCALLLWSCTNLLSPWATVWMFRIGGGHIAYGEALQIHCRNLPAKYLPGGIWHSVGRGGDYLRLGMATKVVGWYFFVENLLLVLISFGVSSIVVKDLILDELLQSLVVLLSFGACVALVFTPLVLARVSRPEAFFSLGAYIAALLVLLVYWALVGVTFACYIAAFPGLETARSIPELAGVYVFSWNLGYLALFAPQGIGVSEFIASSLLGSGAVAAQLLALLLGFRLVVLAADLACWLLLGMRNARA